MQESGNDWVKRAVNRQFMDAIAPVAVQYCVKQLKQYDFHVIKIGRLRNSRINRACAERANGGNVALKGGCRGRETYDDAQQLKEILHNFYFVVLFARKYLFYLIAP